MWECLAHIMKNAIDFSGLTTGSKKLVKGCYICGMP